ncbi:MAG: YcxB family protein [Anaerolineaceae bacterium]|jgi:hypothetical protein|nr:YcxB family protein [Anaerolineaceae bacterium]MDD4043016.1 YcxB family protein [Anaerolineaceae bacterium]MDD4578812.1 YcxB family protein [Anaerolineaceae bacterium]
MTKNYILDPQKLSKQNRGIILLYAITGAIAMLVIFLTQRQAANPPWLAIISIPLLIIFVAARSIRQRKELWDQYMLTWEDGFLIQSQPNYPDTKVPLTSVTRIEETKDGLYLSTRQGNRIFGIPRQLREEDYEELRVMLNEAIAKQEESLPEEEVGKSLEPADGASAVESEAERVDDLPGDEL